MASQEEIGAAASSARCSGSNPAAVSPKAKAKVKAKASTRRRAERPRLDIDDQIQEANRVHDMLKKMSCAAKQLKKSQTKAKQRLIKKASRLNPEDLERIAVLKRVFHGGQEGDAASSSAASSSSVDLSAQSPNPSKGIRRLHSSLRSMMTNVKGADGVIESLGAEVPENSETPLAARDIPDGTGPRADGAESAVDAGADQASIEAPGEASEQE